MSSLLASRGLTLYRVSRMSLAMYGRDSARTIPHNFYSQLRGEDFRPSLYQISALEHISGLPLQDWLRLFGVDVTDIPRLQVLLRLPRTHFIDSTLHKSDSRTLNVRPRTTAGSPGEIAPFSLLLQVYEVSLTSRTDLQSGRYLYARVGREDALAFPEIAPDSLVRVDREASSALLPAPSGGLSNRFFLLEHSRGLFCCRLRRTAADSVSAVSLKLPYAEVEFKLGSQAKVLGVVDLEIRPLVGITEPTVPMNLSLLWKPGTLRVNSSFPQLLRDGRARMGLSLRAASALTKRIAVELGHRRYAISQSSLFDYEVGQLAPRQIHKFVSLCSIYGLRFETLLQGIGVVAESSQTDHRDLEIRTAGSISDAMHVPQLTPEGVFMQELLARMKDVPFFVRDLVAELSGMREVSIEDFFWIGGIAEPLHPCLSNALVALVNRRKKRPLYSRFKPWYQQPLYLLLRRDGGYLCACCSSEGGYLVVHPYPPLYQPLRFRNGDEAEIVGQVVTVVRSI
jgi:hypothetical protein